MRTKYRKKPVVIEAIRFEKPYWLVREFCPDLVLIRGGVQGTLVRGGIIPTLEGDMRAELGDYIIKGTEGEFYPCKPAAFAATFEAVGA
jgi:hypothetical protein